MEYIRPDYDNCLVNLSNSILRYFGVQTTASTLKLADKLLDHDYRNVIVLLMDAMGTSIIEKHLEPSGFLRSHLAGNYSSVFPPTTVAATTSILSGLYPNEHGWHGWDMFFPELGKNVTVFSNTEQLTEDGNGFIKEPAAAADFHAGFRYCPYKSIIEKINEAGGNAYISSPFAEPNPQDLDAVLERVEKLCKMPEKKFIYAYWGEPDSTMHAKGPYSSEAHDLMVYLEKRIEEFASHLPLDTLLLVTADHSQTACVNRCIMDYPVILKCLVRLPSVEPRTLSFFVKDEYKEEFPSIFKKAFGDKFWLLTKDEVLDKKLFGTGKEHALFRDMLGDYIAISVADEAVFATHIEAEKMPGGHAGLTKEELEIPLIAVSS